MAVLHVWGDAARTATGLFWKAGWAFVLGYGISAMIQAFVPRQRLAAALGGGGLRSVTLASLFGAASSSCSFAALAAARSLVAKGAHFVAAVAFMFASTNLVVELGILIVIFLGWEFLAAELVGGVMLIAVSSLLLRRLVPQAWFDAARKRVEAHGAEEQGDFDWRERLRSREGWRLVGRSFRGDWAMVWEEILIGFTVAGFMAAAVPASFWEALFLRGDGGWAVALQNALVAPLAAAATFIGSMGNIPLATVLHANGVLFAGIMAFIYSDLMVPPLVAINARYYGRRLALTIAGVMYASIVITALAMDGAFKTLGVTPDSSRRVEEVVRFSWDYTTFLNLAFVAVAAALVLLGRRSRDHHGMHHGHDHGHDHGDDGGPGLKRVAALTCAALLAGGWILVAAGG